MFFKGTRLPRELVRHLHLSVELDGKVFLVTGVEQPTACEELVMPAAVVDHLGYPVLGRVNEIGGTFIEEAIAGLGVVQIRLEKNHIAVLHGGSKAEGQVGVGWHLDLESDLLGGAIPADIHDEVVVDDEDGILAERIRFNNYALLSNLSRWIGL